jgi:hypothetical protein
MKKVITILITTAFISTFLFTGCGESKEVSNLSDTTSTEETAQEETGKGGITENDIDEYFKENLLNLGDHYSTIISSDYCLIDLYLADNLQDGKYNYPDFAEDAVKLTKKFSKKYDFTDIDLTLHFFKDEYTTTSWKTSDFGASGTFTDETEVNDYKNVQNYSLKELKKAFSKY